MYTHGSSFSRILTNDFKEGGFNGKDYTILKT